jgi:hypothetical protein
VSDDYLWDRSGRPDPDVVRLERVLGSLRLDHPAAPMPRPAAARVRTATFFMALLAEAAMVAAIVGSAWFTRFALSGASLEVTRLAGTPSVGSASVEDRQQLRIGRWLQTDAQSRASIDIPGVGRVEVDPLTRLGLLSRKPGDYRLQLDRGTLHALIWAPPGQFLVETPSSTAIDLGCAYTLTVDENGTGLVRVTSGWVGFEWHGRESFIPTGAVCQTRRGLGPGTPHFEETSEAFRAALEAIDTGRGSAASRAAGLRLVLDESQPRDAVTLWHLLTRVNMDQRDSVFDRLSQLVAPPAGVTREGIREGNRAMLDLWWDQMGFGTANWWRVWKQQWRDGTGR